MIVPAQ